MTHGAHHAPTRERQGVAALEPLQRRLRPEPVANDAGHLPSPSREELLQQLAPPAYRFTLSHATFPQLARQTTTRPLPTVSGTTSLTADRAASKEATHYISVVSGYRCDGSSILYKLFNVAEADLGRWRERLVSPNSFNINYLRRHNRRLTRRISLFRICKITRTIPAESVAESRPCIKTIHPPVPLGRRPIRRKSPGRTPQRWSRR